jgi:hypothetical protein
MKRVGIRLLLSVILVTMLIVIAATPASAAKPVRVGLTIIDFSEGSITVSYWWDRIGAHSYLIGVFDSVGAAVKYTHVDLGERTRSASGNITITDPGITCGQSYGARIWLERRAARTIRGATAFDRQDFDCPAPSCIFYEDFTGVAQYSLPGGWVTSNSSKCYVDYSINANTTAPALYIEYGDSSIPTYDYWVHTPSINATNTTATLGLTFKHALWIWGYAKNFTYSVEVSNDAGSNWTAVLEETPVDGQYPEDRIGPETVTIDLSAYVGDNILIRWRLREYTYYSNDWYIDNICVHGS